MVKYCSVPQCRSYATDPDISFHIYPKEKQLRKEWLVKLRMGKLNSKSSTVCSRHFRDEDFVYAVGAKMFGKCSEVILVNLLHDFVSARQRSTHSRILLVSDRHEKLPQRVMSRMRAF